MKRLLLMALLCVGAFARTVPWQDATVAAIETQHGENGTAVLPMAGGLIGIPFERWTTYYSIDTPTVRYVLSNGNRKPLNLTLHGKTKIAPDGLNAYLLDDAGKQIKLPIVQKIAREPETK